MLPQDFTGRIGPKTPQPDVVKVREPKEEDTYYAPVSDV
jgi:hypothetical protein